MSPSRFARSARAAATVVLGVGVLALAGCGGDDDVSGDAAAGKAVFQQSCAGCHALQDAVTPEQRKAGYNPPTIGPSLDDSFRAARAAGIDEAQFAGLVERWIEIAQLPMPQDLVDGEEQADVAAYIASVAGREGTESAVRRQDEPTPEVVTPSRQEPAKN